VILPVEHALRRVGCVRRQPVDRGRDRVVEQELARVGDVAAGVGRAGDLPTDVNLDVDVRRPALVVAGVDGGELGDALRVRELDAP
jgi:hypothetical protein